MLVERYDHAINIYEHFSFAHTQVHVQGVLIQGVPVQGVHVQGVHVHVQGVHVQGLAP